MIKWYWSPTGMLLLALPSEVLSKPDRVILVNLEELVLLREQKGEEHISFSLYLC